MLHVEDAAVKMAISSLSKIPVPIALQERIRQHQQHLTDLASALLSGGQSRETVRQAIEIVMDSFKLELTATIAAIVEKKDAH